MEWIQKQREAVYHVENLAALNINGKAIEPPYELRIDYEPGVSSPIVRKPDRCKIQLLMPVESGQWLLSDYRAFAPAQMVVVTRAEPETARIITIRPSSYLGYDEPNVFLGLDYEVQDYEERRYEPPHSQPPQGE